MEVVMRSHQKYTIPNTKMAYNINVPIQPHDIPKGITRISFGRKFQQNLTRGCLPDTIESITLAYYRGGIIEDGSLPPRLKRLLIGKYYNGLVPTPLPPTIRHLRISGKVWNTIEVGAELQILNIYHLDTIHANFSSIKELHLQTHHESLPISSLCKNLVTLSIGDDAPMSFSLLDFVLQCKKLQHLLLGKFIEPSLFIKANITSLVSLYISYSQYYKIDAQYHTLDMSMYTNLECLIFDKNATPIRFAPPVQLRRLVLSHHFNHYIDFQNNTPSLEALNVGKHYNHPLTYPPTLTSLKFGNPFPKDPLSLPCGLRNLSLPFRYNKMTKFPPSLVSLRVDGFNKPINHWSTGYLPNLEELVILGYNKYPIVLPPTVVKFSQPNQDYLDENSLTSFEEYHRYIKKEKRGPAIAQELISVVGNPERLSNYICPRYNISFKEYCINVLS